MGEGVASYLRGKLEGKKRSGQVQKEGKRGIAKEKKVASRKNERAEAEHPANKGRENEKRGSPVEVPERTLILKKKRNG